MLWLIMPSPCQLSMETCTSECSFSVRECHASIRIGPQVTMVHFRVQAVAVAVICASVLTGASPGLVHFLLSTPWDRLQHLPHRCEASTTLILPQCDIRLI